MMDEVISEEIYRVISEDFYIEHLYLDERSPTLSVRPRYDLARSHLSLQKKLERFGYLPYLREREGRLILKLVYHPKPKPERKLWNILLFLATIGTTLYVGYTQLFGYWHGAVLFSVGIMGVLGCHELGHKLMSDRRDVDATYPYFIPVPFILGTFGAVIKTRTPAPNRNALFDVGAAGPIAGFIVLIPITLLGISWSNISPIESLPENVLRLPTPFLFWLFQQLLVDIPPGYTLVPHPLAFAGLIGMVVTMLNLMPVAMLDGGHIARVVLGMKRHRIISLAASALTFALGFFLMALLMLFFAARPHPGPLNDVTSLSKKRKIISVFIALMFVLCLSSIWGTI